jgi:hypothetical protein
MLNTLSTIISASNNVCALGIDALGSYGTTFTCGAYGDYSLPSPFPIDNPYSNDEPMDVYFDTLIPSPEPEYINELFDQKNLIIGLVVGVGVPLLTSIGAMYWYKHRRMQPPDHIV